MTAAFPTLQPMVDKLLLWKALDAADVAAIIALPHRRQRLRANDYIVREDDEPQHACLLLSGFAFRHKQTGSGARQIFSIHMKGDVVDLPNAIIGRADHNVQALTEIEVAFVPVGAIVALAAARPLVGLAMWCETLVDASIFREWTLNVGRRDARARTAHLLCEFAVRLRVARPAGPLTFTMPMTQEQLADSLALTNVHVSRMLKALAEDGLIQRTHRALEIVDFARLATIGDFDGRYLHYDRVPDLVS